MATVAPNSGSTVKILAVGAAAGAIRELFTKIKAINAKHGKFDMVLCVGDFFGPPKEEGTSGDDLAKLLAGELEAPLECYIMPGEHPLPDVVIEKYTETGGELCKNVFLLNKSGVLNTANGLRIACLGGMYDAEIYHSSETAPGFSSPFFAKQTVERLLSNTLTKSSSSQAKSYGSLAAIRDGTSSSQLVDILLTDVPPSSITGFSSMSALENLSGAPPIDEVVRKTKPRYHFSAGVGTSPDGMPPKFWEREPFVWDDEVGRVTRYISLGAFGGDYGTNKRERWFYAFSIATPNISAARPANSTKNPFTENVPQGSKRPHSSMEEGGNYIFGNVKQPGKRQRNHDQSKPPPGYKCRRCDGTDHFINDCPERQKPPEGYVCKICNTPGHLVRDCPTRHAVGDTGGKKPREGYVCRACGSEAHYIEDCPVANQRHSAQKRGPPKEIGPNECWFCLSNPNLAKHLIVSIGTECYVTLPKGQLIPTQSAAQPNGVTVPGGGHLLIVPINHYPTFHSVASDQIMVVLDEVTQFKTALQSMFAKYGCVPVYFEVNRVTAKGGHAHVQVIPLPRSYQGAVGAAFVDHGRSLGISFESSATADVALDACIQSGSSYFRVDLPDGGKLIHRMKDGVPFSVNFGRQVLADLLKLDDRVDWKACLLTEDEDKADVEAFKTAFASFDPSL